MKMKFLCASIWMLLLSALCFGQTEDPLTFQFNSPTLKWSSEYSSHFLRYDSIEKINGKYPLCFCNLRSFGESGPLRTIVRQTILLSNNSGGILDFSIHNKTTNLQKAEVIVQTYNEHEELLKEDSVNILSNDAYRWKWSKLKMPAHPFRFIRITIKAIGTTDYQYTEQQLALDRITLLVNGKNINQSSCLQPSVAKQPLILDTKAVYPLNDTTSLSISPFRDKKILGLGETMHQNRAIQKTVFEILRKHIEHNRCRLILLESPLDFGLQLNWYVSDKAPDWFIEVIERNTELTYDSGFIDFICWLRQYNHDNPEQQTRLLCMDVCAPVVANSMLSLYFDSSNISQVLLAAMKEDSLLEISAFTKSVITNQYEDARAEMLVQQNELTKALGVDNFKILQEILLQMSHIYPEKNEQRGFMLFNTLTGRDYQMFLNYEKLSSMFLKADEKVVIYAHIAHLAKSQTYSDKNLGSYLFKKYSSKYSPLALVAGEGNSTMYAFKPMVSVARDSLKWEAYYTYPLKTPVQSSLEASAINIPYERYFYPLDAARDNLSGLGLMKIIPNGIVKERDYEQFIPVSYHSWMDGFIFVREGEMMFDLEKVDVAKKVISTKIELRDQILNFLGVKLRR